MVVTKARMDMKELVVGMKRWMGRWMDGTKESESVYVCMYKLYEIMNSRT